MIASRRRLLAFVATLPAIGFASRQAGAQGTPPRPARVLSAADLAALREPDAGLEERALGSPDAKVTLVEYASLTCPHCAAFHTEIVPILKTRYVDTGQMRLVFRNFVLNALDAGAAMLTRCAPAERFFPMTDVLFQQQNNWSRANDPVAALLQIARQAGFSQESFERCLRDQALLDRLNAARERGARRFGVNSTPTLIINEQVHAGALRIEQIEAIIAPLLRT